MKAFSIVAALATAVQAGALIMLHLLPTGYNPVRDAVSDYGVGRYRGWFWLQAVAGGVGCLALGIALAQLHPFTPTQVVVALIVTAAARFLLPFFATDQQGSRFQTLTRHHSHDPGGHRLRRAGMGGHRPVVHAAPLPGLARGRRRSHHHPLDHARQRHRRRTRAQSPRLKPFFGVFERLFYLSSITWVLIVAIDLARISG